MSSIWPYLLVSHSFLRWFVLASLVGSIAMAVHGLIKKRSFSKVDNSLRHWTATIGHLQLMVGMMLYTQSPIVKYYWHEAGSRPSKEFSFFGLLHIALMLLAVVVLTVSSSLAKRKTTDQEKFKTILTWYSVTLLIIFVAIPWPFSLLSNRPYLRLL